MHPIEEGSVHVPSLLQQHRSIRKFKNQSIPAQDLEQIISSAQMAATSSHVQAYSMIGVTDDEMRSKLAEWAGGQKYIQTCAHFVVFCADLHRVGQTAAQQGIEINESLEHTELFIVATVDAALAAQNAAIAAESLGLGIVYIGGLRNNPDKVSDLLQLPHHVYPVFGMCMGYPDQDPAIKPRLPQQAVYYENRYPAFEEIQSAMDQYDQTMRAYYIERTGGKRSDTWSEMMAQMLQQPRRAHMKSFLEKRGFLFK